MKRDHPAAIAPRTEPEGPGAAAWSGLLAGMPHPAWVVALRDGRVAAANAAAAALFGRPLAAMVGVPAEQLAAAPEDLLWWEAALAGRVEPLFSNTVVTAADGRIVHASRSIGLIDSPGGGSGLAAHALVVLCDRSAEQRAEAQREGLLAELQATLEATADGILVTDLSGGIRAFNRRFAEIWNLPPELLAQRDDVGVQAWMAQSVDGPGAGPSYASRLQLLMQATAVSASDRIELHSGQILERVTRPLHQGGLPLGRVWSFRDLTARIAAEDRAEALAWQDLLTGLPNRRRLAEQVDAAAVTARRTGGLFALLVIGLDRFRQINDILGHDVGDRVLRDAARRIQSCIHGDDVLARLGGDQFALLLHGADEGSAEALARRVLNVVSQPWSFEGAQFTITCSIGIALAPLHGTRIDELARRAERAMRSVKSAGRAHYRLHQGRAEGDRSLHMKLDHAMRQALVSGRFRLHYQPQVDLASGKVIAAEALLRWRDPELGDVGPGTFIPVAEDSGFIVAIGDWVLEQAVRQAALWHQRGRSLPIAINVSALQFQQSNFVDRVAGVLAVAGLPPPLLELELTESILVHDADEALLRLNALAELGVRLSIDDFGTGYSSLSYLKRFPIDKLKIDRSFIMGLPADGIDAGIVRAILQMARALDMKVIAEGVETEAQRDFLHDAGCDEFQGFLFAKALDCLSFEQRVGMAGAPQPPLRTRTKPLIRLVGR